MNTYDEVKRSTLSPNLRKCIEELVTGQDVPRADISIGANALETLANELAVFDVAMNNLDNAEVALMLSPEDMLVRLGRIVVRARATFQLVELLELQPEAETESRAAE